MCRVRVPEGRMSRTAGSNLSWDVLCVQKIWFPRPPGLAKGSSYSTIADGLDVPYYRFSACEGVGMARAGQGSLIQAYGQAALWMSGSGSYWRTLARSPSVK